MADPMRIALATYGAQEFAALHEICRAAGHTPVAFVYCRSMRPKGPTDNHVETAVGRILDEIPPGTDLLLPGAPAGLARALAGYDLDLLVAYGFNWKLTVDVLTTPRLGAINVHSSMLPKYRGPAPVLWAIRNGDAQIGMTVHRMDERFDAGPILAQQGGIPLDDDVTPERLSQRVKPVLADVLTTALDQVSQGVPGIPQDDGQASYAGFVEPEFHTVDWSRTAREIHNQVRMFRFIGRAAAPVARVDGRWLKVFRTRLGPGPGIRAESADGPIWIIESEDTDPPVTGP